MIKDGDDDNWNENKIVHTEKILKMQIQMQNMKVVWVHNSKWRVTLIIGDPPCYVHLLLCKNLFFLIFCTFLISLNLLNNYVMYTPSVQKKTFF